MASSPLFGNILQIGDVLLHADILTQPFCCDLEACKGACCVEGDAGAPVTLQEIAAIEEALPDVLPQLTQEAREVVGRQGVSYIDIEGDLVTSIVAGKDCAFVGHDGGCTRCLLQAKGCKPMSCFLYPIREKTFKGGIVGLNYHRWAICHHAIEKGRELNMPLYKFLREPLIRRFGPEWYAELEEVAKQLE